MFLFFCFTITTIPICKRFLRDFVSGKSEQRMTSASSRQNFGGNVWPQVRLFSLLSVLISISVWWRRKQKTTTRNGVLLFDRLLLDTMVRKSKQAGGHMPLTHYERTKKFASSEYGTTTKRLAGHSQYQLGDCALSLTKLDETALCTPSGYLYSDSAIVEYLLTKTQELKEQQAAYERQQAALVKDDGEADRKRRADFEESQKVVKKSKKIDSRQVAKQELKRTSYWLADSQPNAVEQTIEKPPERPQSPHSQQPLRRKDLWPVHIQWEDDKFVCAVSGKALNAQDVVCYWTDKKQPGIVVLQSVYDQLIADTKQCPNSSRKIKYTRKLQKSGTSFASSGQNVQVQKYRPTIT